MTAQQISDAVQKVRDGNRCAAITVIAHHLEARGDLDGLGLLAEQLGLTPSVPARLEPAHPPCVGERPLPGMEIGGAA